MSRRPLLTLVVLDGPHSYEQDIAGLLAASGSNATFFLNGNSEQPVPSSYLPLTSLRRLGLYLRLCRRDSSVARGRSTSFLSFRFGWLIFHGAIARSGLTLMES
jgi:hypothetical protein